MMITRALMSIVLMVSISGLPAQEKKPQFVTGSELATRKAAEDRATKEKEAKEEELKAFTTKLEAYKWIGKKFWFVPNPKLLRPLRFGFATSMEKEARKEDALLYPADISTFTVVGVNHYAESEFRNTVHDGNYLRVKFDDGPYAYIMEESFVVRLSEMTSQQFEKPLLGDETSYLIKLLNGETMGEAFFPEEPKALIENFNIAMKKQEQANSEKKALANVAKKKALATSTKRQGGKSNGASEVSSDQAAAKRALAKMRPHIVASVSIEDDWVVVTFGPDFFYWTESQREAIVTTYANTDASATGQARSLEFRSPTGKLVARADRARGIQMK